MQCPYVKDDVYFFANIRQHFSFEYDCLPLHVRSSSLRVEILLVMPDDFGKVKKYLLLQHFLLSDNNI